MMGMMSQGGSKGPDPASADDPSVQMGRLFPPMDHLSPEEKSEAMERAFERLKASFDMLAKPDGTQKAPAKNCQTLKTNHPTKPSGDYWIDPNGMDAKDAILAYCDMQTGSTCIQPKPAVSHEITVMSDDKEVWVGELDTNAFDINYKADSNQMNFLQLSSSSAEQIITFHCKDTVAHLNRANNKRHAVSLMAWNDLEIRHRGKARYSVLSDELPTHFHFSIFHFFNFHFRYSVLSDECQHKKRSWAQTVFKVQSRKPARLPIVDVQVQDFGRSSQAFKIEVGQVCFS